MVRKISPIGYAMTQSEHQNRNFESRKSSDPIGGDGSSQRFVQYATFKVSNHLYGVPVIRVREVVRPLPITEIPLATEFVHGLINLRGQVVTAVGVHRLFGISSPSPADLMNVICETSTSLISLHTDEIGDVIELDSFQMEPPPATTGEKIRSLLHGVYKMPDGLLSVIDVDLICRKINDVACQQGVKQ